MIHYLSIESITSYGYTAPVYKLLKIAKNNYIFIDYFSKDTYFISNILDVFPIISKFDFIEDEEKPKIGTAIMNFDNKYFND